MSDNVQMYKANDPQITLTERALAHVESYIAKRGRGLGLRMSITKTGCSGLAYVIDLIDQPQENDLFSQITPTVAVYVDPEALQYVRGTEIDYVKEGLNHRFTFKNPNQSGTCGCGESFSV